MSERSIRRGVKDLLASGDWNALPDDWKLALMDGLRAHLEDQSLVTYRFGDLVRIDASEAGVPTVPGRVVGIVVYYRAEDGVESRGPWVADCPEELSLLECQNGVPPKEAADVRQMFRDIGFVDPTDER